MWQIKNKIFCRKYENFSWKTDFIHLTKFEQQWRSTRANWIYFTFIFTILEAWTTVILLLKTILWEILFGNVVPCVAAYTKNAEASGSCCVIYVNEKSRVKNGCTMKADWKTKQKRYDTYIVCVFMPLLLLIMFFEIVFISRHHADLNGFSVTHAISNYEQVFDFD